MVKLEAAYKRLFVDIFVCRKCNTKIRANPRKIAEGKIKCRKCKGNVFRAKKKKATK